MVTSYQLSERINFQVVLWVIASAVYWTVAGSVIALRWTVATIVAGLIALAPYAGTLAKGLALTALVAGVAAAVAMIPLTFWAGLGVIAVVGWVTYPRPKAAQPGS